jgi:hypothetical protein
MMNKLPFLKGTKWPRVGKPSGESKYGFSEDDDLMEQLLGELMAAYESKDHVALIDSLKALIHLIQSKEGSDAQHDESPA